MSWNKLQDTSSLRNILLLLEKIFHIIHLRVFYFPLKGMSPKHVLDVVPADLPAEAHCCSMTCWCTGMQHVHGLSQSRLQVKSEEASAETEVSL